MLKKFVHIKDLYPVKFVDITGKIYNIDDYKELNYAENHDPMGTFMYTVKLSSETNICTGKVTDRCGDHIGDCASGPHHTWTPFKWILDDSGSYFQCEFDSDVDAPTCKKADWQCSNTPPFPLNLPPTPAPPTPTPAPPTPMPICTGKVLAANSSCREHDGDCGTGPNHNWSPFQWILDDSGSYFQCTFDTDAGWGSSTCIKGWQCSISASGEDYYSI